MSLGMLDARFRPLLKTGKAISIFYQAKQKFLAQIESHSNSQYEFM
jgi:hypothetical protein